MFSLTNLVTFSLLLSISLSAQGAGDIKAGAKIFSDECSECHSMKEGKNKKGPSIFGLVGRKAGTLSDYDYSDAIKSSGIVWNSEKLNAYITSPQKMLPAGKMKYDGLSNEKSRQDLITYLNFFSE
jgi:cytochrome c